MISLVAKFSFIRASHLLNFVVNNEITPGLSADSYNTLGPFVNSSIYKRVEQGRQATNTVIDSRKNKISVSVAEPGAKPETLSTSVRATTDGVKITDSEYNSHKASATLKFLRLNK